MKRVLALLLFSLGSLSGFSQQLLTLEDTLRGALTKERTCFDVHYYDLAVTVNVSNQRISGSTTIHFKAIEDFNLMQLDLHKQLSVDKIVDGQGRLLNFQRQNNTIFVRFSEIQKKDSKAQLKIYYNGSPKKAVNPPWDGGFVWTSDSLGRPWVALACEGVGASLWWPCKDHPSDEPDSMRMKFEVPQPLFCASNGNLIRVATTDKNTTLYTWAVHYPINTYNVTLNIGYFVQLSDVYKRKDSSALSLDYYVLSYHKEKAEKHFKQVKPMLEVYEALFGKYPFEQDGYAVIEAPYWGMEHQSAIAYGNEFRTNAFGFDYILVHESAHEWWGNNVSCADHADLWIHEAFATYTETLLIECFHGKKAAKEYLAQQKIKIENKEAIVGPYDVNYHYWKDSDMYYKGAWVLHTLRRSIDNDSLWFSLLLAIQKKFSGKQISGTELISFINTFVRYDYTSFFNHYLFYLEKPLLVYHISEKDERYVQIEYKWETKGKEFSMPIVVTVNGSKKIQLFPTDKFQTLVLPKNKKKNYFAVEADAFYINTLLLKKIKRK